MLEEIKKTPEDIIQGALSSKSPLGSEQLSYNTPKFDDKLISTPPGIYNTANFNNLLNNIIKSGGKEKPELIDDDSL